MASIEIVVNVVGAGTSGAAAADTIVQSFNSGAQNFELVNNVGQVVANVVGIIPILAPIGIQVNTLAGTMTFLKIQADLRDGKPLNVGDTLNLVGNVAGIVASVMILLAAPPAAVLITAAVAIAASSAGVLTADDGLRDWTINQVRSFWPQVPVQDLNQYWIDVEGRARRYDDIANDPNSGFKTVRWGSDGVVTEGKSETPPPRRPNDEEVDGDGLF